MNKCKTAQGTRLLLQWLKQPLLDIKEIRKRQDIVGIFTDQMEIRQKLQDDFLKKIPDLNRLAKRFQKKIASLQDVVRLYQVVLSLPSIISTLSSLEGEEELKLIKETFTSKLTQCCEDLDKFQAMVETTVDLEQVANHEYIIKPEFDEKLQELRTSMEGLWTEISKFPGKVGSDLDMTVKLESSQQYGCYLKIGRKESSKLRGNSQYIELSTTKSGVYFTTSKLKNLSDKYNALKQEYEERQSSLVKDVVTIVATYCPVMEDVNEIIAQLDVYISLAYVGVQAPTPYIKPILRNKGEGEIILKAARHPCMEVQDDVAFIPNDVNILKNKSTFQIITGPNMGGKSTYIRQIGVIVLMAQVGCFVPCNYAEISLCDAILARVGAGDSQLKGVSTFMAEMLETAAIIKTATENSLIIIDELGRGTSTYDGFGLAWAISEYISTKIRCPCLFATHFHELTTLSEKVPSVANYHVTAHTSQNAITLLYKVIPGVCDQSFGIHVAELARFPDKVVQLAKRKAEELEDFANNSNPNKRSKDEIEEGEKIIEEFLARVSHVPVNSLDDEQLLNTLKSLRTELEKSQNPFIQDILVQVQ